MTDCADDKNRSGPASTVQVTEENVVNKGDNTARDVADNQDLVGASHMAVDVEPLSENKWDEGLTSKPIEKSFPERYAVLPITVRDVSGQPKTVDTTGETFEDCKLDNKKIEEEKADGQMAPLLEERRITIPELHASTEHVEGTTQCKGFSEQGSLECLDVIISVTGEIDQAKDLPDELQPGVTTEDVNEKIEDDEKMEKEKEDKKVERETHCTAIQDAPGPSEPGERITQNRQEPKQVQINFPSTDQHSNVAEVDLSAKDLLSFSWQIASGMLSAEIKTRFERQKLCWRINRK